MACYSSSNQAPAIFIQDPLPKGAIAVKVDLLILGSLDCQFTNTDVNLFLLFQNHLVNSTTIPDSVSCDQSAGCTNCIFSFPMPGEDFSEGWPSYQYGGTNAIEMIVSHSTLCIHQLVVFIFYHFSNVDPTIRQIYPSSGPITGGTTISIFGENFSSDLVCDFDGVTTPATLLSEDDDRHLFCVSPPKNSPGVVNMTLRYEVDISPSRDFINFTYYESPIIESVSPNTGSEDGGTTVVITGVHFSEHFTLQCKFGNSSSSQQAPGYFISSTSIRCSAPPGQGKVQIGVAENGVQFVFSEAYLFEYKKITRSFLSENMDWFIVGICFFLFLAMVVGIFVYIRVRSRSLPRNSDSEQGTPLLSGQSSKSGSSSSTSRRPFLRVNVNSDADLSVRPSSAPTNGIDSSSRHHSDVSFGEIKLGERIGRGSAGDVFKAIWCGTEVAVKILPNQILNRKNGTEDTLYKEAAIMRGLRHPNVLQFLGACTVPQVCIIMEYMPRGSLYLQIHNPKMIFTYQLIQQICIDAAKGLRYLHSFKPPIIHRDLKSHNLLVDRSWKVKVADFGLSRMADVRRTMTACGTPCWTAPEVLRKEHYSEKADIYSLAIVFWELVTRQDPYVGMDAYQVVFAVGTQNLRPPLPTHCHSEMKKLIADCWQEDPASRPNIEEALQRLEKMNFVNAPPLPPYANANVNNIISANKEKPKKSLNENEKKKEKSSQKHESGRHRRNSKSSQNNENKDINTTITNTTTPSSNTNGTTNTTSTRTTTIINNTEQKNEHARSYSSNEVRETLSNVIGNKKEVKMTSVVGEQDESEESFL